MIEEGIFARLVEAVRSASQGAPKLDYDLDVTPEMLRARYERGGIVRALVDARPDSTWAGDHELTLDGTPSPELQELAEVLELWNVFARVDLASEITGLGVVYLPGPDPDTPPTPQDLALAELAVYGLDQIKPPEPTSPNAMWSLTLTTNETIEVHPLRLVPIADTRYSASGLVGLPRMKSAWNLITDFDRLAGGGALAFYKNSFGLRQIDFAPEASPTKEQQDQLREQVREVERGTDRLLLTTGAKLALHAPQAVSYHNEVRQQHVLLAASWRVPMTVATGEALVAHSAATNMSDWDSRTAERRTSWAAPRCAAPVIAWIVSIRDGLGGYVDRENRARYGVAWEEPPPRAAPPPPPREQVEADIPEQEMEAAAN